MGSSPVGDFSSGVGNRGDSIEDLAKMERVWRKEPKQLEATEELQMLKEKISKLLVR